MIAKPDLIKEPLFDVNVEFLTAYLIWGDEKLIKLLENLNDEEFSRSFGELVGSIHSKTAHILSVYEFFVKIIEGDPYEKFPDLSHLSRTELIAKWETIVKQWPTVVSKTENADLFGMPLAGGQQVEAKHVFLDALLHTVHHRAQILTFIRLLGKTKEDVPTGETNMDYLMYLFMEHPETIHPPQR